MKNFVGIDFAKEKFDVALISSDYTSDHKAEHAVFENSAKGFADMLKWLKDKYPEAEKDDTAFCGENTGVYSRPAAEYLSSKGYRVYIENAYRIRQSSGLLRGKSDSRDALMIAEYILRNGDKALEYRPVNPVLKELDDIFKQRRLIVKQNTEIKNRIDSFSFGASDMDGLKELAAKCCAAKDGKMKFDYRRLQRLDYKKQLIVSDLMTIRYNNMYIARLDKMMESAIGKDEPLRENYDIVTSIPGLALQNAAALLIYTENFERFGYDARKLASYYGVAVFGKDSGTSVHTAPHTSYLANKQLKSLLTQAALAATMFCAPIRSYYTRLLQRGKDRMLAQNNVKNKLLHMVMAMVRTRTKYSDEAYKNSAARYTHEAPSVGFENI